MPVAEIHHRKKGKTVGPPHPSYSQGTSTSFAKEKQARLSRILQVGYPTLCSWIEAKCEAAFAAAGCVPRLRNRHCWKCGKVLILSTGEGQTALRCVSKGPPRCNVKIRSGKITYTPLQATKKLDTQNLGKLGS